MEEGGGGLRSLVPGGPLLLVLYGLLEASGGGRALPQLSDDIPFRVNWPGTEFSLVSALLSRSLLPTSRTKRLSQPSVSLAFPSRTFFSSINVPQTEGFSFVHPLIHYTHCRCALHTN